MVAALNLKTSCLKFKNDVVTHVGVRLGDPLDLEKALLEVTDLSEVYAVARVPEHQAGRMKPGTTFRYRIRSTAGKI